MWFRLVIEVAKEILKVFSGCYCLVQGLLGVAL